MISAIKDSKRIFSQNGGGGANGLNYKGTWDANLNNPFLASGVGIQGDYYVVSVAGNTTLDGVTSWDVSDWAIFNGTVWQKIDNTVYVPYSGATGDVDLGEYELKAGQIELDQSPSGTAGTAVTRWNDTIGSTETTLKGGSVVLKNGVDLVARVVNKVIPNTTLTKAAYQVVKISGAQGQRLAIDLAQANNDNNSADTLGVVIETIPTNQEGFIMTVGQIESINTTGSLQGESWSDGNVLYLSPTTPGALTNVKPNGSTGHIVIVGYVEHAHITQGKIYVKIMNGWELDELHNVYINPGTLANNDALIYESSTQLWKNKTIPTALGYTPENVANKENTTLDNSTTKYPTNNLVKTNIDTKVTANTTITGATKTKITYDSKGLVTSGADATTADIADSLNKRYVTDANLTVIGNTSGTNTGDETNTTIKTKLGAASTTTDGYLTSTDWNTFNGKQNALGFTPENVANKSTDTNLGTSNTLYPTQNAVKTYADNLLGNANALVYKGVIDCSGNPNYPAANAGELYIASVAGKIGGALGIDVEVGDMIICNTDSTPSGDQATVGVYWNIIQKNIVGAVTGPASSTNNNVAFFDGATGKVIKDSGITLSGTNTGDQTLSGLGGVPTSRNLTVNGTSADLSADRTFTVTDANLSTSDVTTNDVSTTKHGFAPKLPNDATKYLDGTGNYSTPAGGGGGDILQFQVFS